jgi:purine-binding chemotaxis protein CheW
MMEEAKARDIEQDLFLEDDDDENSQVNKYLLFNIGAEVYGINIGSVTEIIEMQKITEMPDMPDYVKGVINLRGRVIPVLELRLRFGMEEREHDDRTCIIIVNIEDISLGFIVDTVAEVHDIPDKDIEPPPMYRDGEDRNRYIAGLGKIGDEVKILLNANKILHEQEITNLGKAAVKKEESQAVSGQ